MAVLLSATTMNRSPRRRGHGWRAHLRWDSVPIGSPDFVITTSRPDPVQMIRWADYQFELGLTISMGRGEKGVGREVFGGEHLFDRAVAVHGRRGLRAVSHQPGPQGAEAHLRHGAVPQNGQWQNGDGRSGRRTSAAGPPVVIPYGMHHRTGPGAPTGCAAEIRDRDPRPRSAAETCGIPIDADHRRRDIRSPASASSHDRRWWNPGRARRSRHAPRQPRAQLPAR